MTARRRDDPDEFDASAMRRDNGATVTRRGFRVSGPYALPMLSIVAAVAAFLGWLYLTTSPLQALGMEEWRRVQAAREIEHATLLRVIRHEVQLTREALRVYRLTCAGVWRGQPEIAKWCYAEQDETKGSP